MDSCFFNFRVDFKDNPNKQKIPVIQITGNGLIFGIKSGFWKFSVVVTIWGWGGVKFRGGEGVSWIWVGSDSKTDSDMD